MPAVWKNWDPEAIEGYIAACKILEDGQARVQVLGDHTIRLICYGGKQKVLPALYVTNVPDEWIGTFKLNHKDDIIALTYLSDKPQAFLDVYEGHASEEEKKEVIKDVLEDWNKDLLPSPVTKGVYAWRNAGSLLRKIFETHFKRGGKK